jgi:hypothetical protein
MVDVAVRGLSFHSIWPFLRTVTDEKGQRQSLDIQAESTYDPEGLGSVFACLHSLWRVSVEFTQRASIFVGQLLRFGFLPNRQLCLGQTGS